MNSGAYRFRAVLGRLVAGIAMSACGVAALAQPDEQQAAQRKLLAKRAAEADAYRKLAEAVYGLQINSTTRVRDFVTESDEIRTAVEAFIKGIRLGQPTWYDDESCEVPAEVTVARVIETLREVHRRVYKGDRVKSSDFEALTRDVEKRVLRVVGMGAPRPDIPPDLPPGVAEALGPPPAAASAGPPPVPGIWTQIGPQARLMALNAARRDAQRRLAERIKGLRLTSRTLVRDFVTESDVIDTELSAFLVGAEEVGTYLRNDELIAEVTMRVPTEQVITTIKELHKRHYKGDELKRGVDVESVVREVVKRDFTETGMGVPPPQHCRQYAQQTHMPDWALSTVEAEGAGTDPEMNTPQGRLRAARAAEADARRRLSEQIAGLSLRAETHVRDFAAQHDHVQTMVDAIISDAAVVSERFSDDAAHVKVAVPGMRVWGVVNTELRRSERRR